MAATLPAELLELVFEGLFQLQHEYELSLRKKEHSWLYYEPPLLGYRSPVFKKLDTVIGTEQTRNTRDKARADLTCAALVNKHWMSIARKKLYTNVHPHDISDVWLLHETLSFWQPDLRSSIRSWSWRNRNNHHADQLAGIPLARILADLPNLESLDAGGRDLFLKDIRLPSLRKMHFGHGCVYNLTHAQQARELLAIPAEERYNRYRKYGLASIHDVLQAIPSLRELSVNGGGGFAYDNIEALCLSRWHTMPSPALQASALTTLQLVSITFHCPNVPEFWQPFRTNLKHLFIEHPNFNCGKPLSLVEAGVTFMLKTIGAQLETFNCNISQPLGSSAFRSLASCKFLGFKPSRSLALDVVDALPGTLEVLYMSEDASEGFAHHFLEQIRHPEFLPNLKHVPFVACRWPEEAEPTSLLEAAKLAMEKRGFRLDQPHLQSSLLCRPDPARLSRKAPPLSDMLAVEQSSAGSEDESDIPGDDFDEDEA